MVRLNGDVNQFVVSTQQSPVGLATFGLVRHHGDHCRIFSDADLPDMQIGHERIAIALDRVTNFVRQIGRRGRTIEKLATVIG